MMEKQKLQQVNDSLKKKFLNKKLVFGRGFAEAKIVFVCEAPGPEEEKEGKPISGHSEKILNQLHRATGIDKNKVYVTNVLKYYPKDKIPTSKEIKSYVPFLKEEIKAIEPRVVVTLGNMALTGIGLRQPLDNIHGRSFNFGSYDLLPTFHPKTTIDNEQTKTLIQNDFIKLKELIKKPLELESEKETMA